MHPAHWLLPTVVAVAATLPAADDLTPPPGFTALFRGKDLEEWKLPKGDTTTWTVNKDGLLDCNPLNLAKGDKSLWTRKSYRDFVLLVEWRLKGERGYTWRVPLLDTEGNVRKDAKGNNLMVEVDDLKSAVLLRGKEKIQVNIGKWPIGSGQIGAPKLDPKTPSEQRAAWTPKKRADLPAGEWNTFEITVKGDHVSVKLNGEDVITDAPLPEHAREGPVGLEYHGTFDLRQKRWKSPPSLVQFRSIYIKELK